MSRVSVTREEIAKLAERFGIVNMESEPMQTIDSVCLFVLTNMPEDDWEAIDKQTRERLVQLGEALEGENLEIVSEATAKRTEKKTTKKVAKKKTSTKKAEAKAAPKPRATSKQEPAEPKRGRGRYSPHGPVATIRRLFNDHGITTVAEMEEALRDEGVDASRATVKTQVGKLRKDAGLSAGRKGRLPSRSGIVYSIRVAYKEKGLKTVKEVTQYLEGLADIPSFSPATVRTQVGRLRKADGLTRERASSPAKKKTAKKAPAKKATKKVTKKVSKKVAKKVTKKVAKKKVAKKKVAASKPDRDDSALRRSRRRRRTADE